VNNSAVFKACLVGCLMSVFIAATAFGESAEFLEGVDQYKKENYEEAAAALTKARQKNPGSTVAAFFLGLAHKQMQDFGQAAENFRDAVTQTPRIKEALVELVEVLSKMGQPENTEEARKWLAVAEKEKIFPAKIAFLNGLILSREGRDLEAVEYFEKAKSLDESFTQSAEFQIAMSYVKAKKLDEAKARFKAAVLFDPESDLASFARQYQDSVEKRLDQQVRFTVGVFGEYDDNALSIWNGAGTAAPAWTGGDDQQTSRVRGQFRVDYVPILSGPWLFNAQYALSSAWNQKFSTSRDNISNGLYLAPGYNFGEFAVNMAINYNFSMKKVAAHGKYRKQSEYLSVGPMVRGLFAQQHLVEAFAGYDHKEFFEPPSSPQGDRDSKSFRSYLSWIWSYTQGAFFNLRYEYTKEDSDGEWWENSGHRISANTSFPVTPRIAFQANGQYLMQNYDSDSILDPIPSDPTKVNERKDEIATGSLGVTWEFMQRTMLICQYTHVHADSSIAIYDYNQNIFKAGVEYRF
jgi:Tfp pilus assembly protein PilF